MRAYRATYGQPIPPAAKVKRDRQGQYILLVDRQGQAKKARIKTTAAGRRMIVPSSYYTIIFRDHLGIERRLRGHRDRGETDLLAQAVGRLVYCRQRGDVLPADVQEWSDALPDETHKALAGFGLLKARRARVSQDLEAMLADFEQHLTVKRQRDPRYIAQVMSKLRTIFAGCGFTTFAQVDDVVLDKFLIGLRESKNLSTRTLNGYLACAQGFCKFAIRKLKVAKSSPLDCMEPFPNPEADRRKQRRALTCDEVQRLLSTTAKSVEVRYGMDARERSLLYRFALTTGLRANEIRSLRVEHFDFDGPEGPIVLVEASYSKHRLRDTLPLHRSLVPELKRFIVDRAKTPQAKLFGGEHTVLTRRTADMIREDAIDAGVEIETVAGELDFHALRHTFVSSLKDVAARTAQGLARHRSSTMTDKYSHRSLAEQRRALDSVDLFGLAS